MQRGLSLTELAQKIEGQRELKQDYIAPSSSIEMIVAPDNNVSLAAPEMTTTGIRPVAHDQIGLKTGIPAKYYDRMLAQDPGLLATNVNRWLGEDDTKRMIRTLGGDVRALLSNRYQRIENEEIAEVALPVLQEIPDIQIVSCEVTERRMYIQATTPRIQGEVRRGDIVQAGLVISNSEVGLGSVSVAAMDYRLVCLNGMISPDRYFKRHVGRHIEDNSDLWGDDTREADDKAVLLKVRDMVRAAVDQDRFQKRIAAMQELTEVHVEGDPAKAVEVLAKKVGATENERGGILRHLIEGGDLSAWGMTNAVTRMAHDVEAYDRSVEFEEMGGQLLNLARSEWREVLEAA